MGFLRKLFGGGGSASGDKDGIYLYVKSNTTGEVVQIRLHRYNDLSPSEGYDSYFARKMIVGRRGLDRMEAEFSFDKKRQLTDANIQGGILVDRADYEAFLAETQASGQ